MHTSTLHGKTWLSLIYVITYRKQNQVITGKGTSVGNVICALEPVRHLFVKRISKDTNDEIVFTMRNRMCLQLNNVNAYHTHKHSLNRTNLLYLVQNSTSYLMKICGRKVSLSKPTGLKNQDQSSFSFRF